MRQIKHEHIWDEAINKAEYDFRLPDGKEMKDKCPWIWSSNMADAYYITAHVLYHSGILPRALHKSKGHSWLIDWPGNGVVKVTVDKPDHRNGVTVDEEEWHRKTICND